MGSLSGNTDLNYKKKTVSSTAWEIALLVTSLSRRRVCFRANFSVCFFCRSFCVAFPKLSLFWFYRSLNCETRRNKSESKILSCYHQNGIFLWLVETNKQTKQQMMSLAGNANTTNRNKHSVYTWALNDIGFCSLSHPTIIALISVDARTVKIYYTVLEIAPNIRILITIFNDAKRKQIQTKALPLPQGQC